MVSIFLSSSYALALIFMLLLQHVSVHAVQKSPIVPAIIAFGDSIIDPGNNNDLLTIFKCNFKPYGQDFAGRKPTGRFCNGKIPTDYIASKLGVKELLPAYSQARNQDLITGVSFASGSSGFDSLTVQVTASLSMPKQLEMFKEYMGRLRRMVGEKKAASIISKSLFIVCAASNDVITYFSSPLRMAQYTVPSYADFLMQSASKFTKELINLGAMKISVIGIPPIGCVPFQRTIGGGPSRDCALDNNQLAQLYNSKISRELQRLSNLHPAKLIYIDIYAPLLDLIQHPKRYGFEESTKGCCGSGTVEGAILCNKFSATCKNTSSYVFWDSFHTSERANQILVDQLIQKYIRFIE